MPKKKDSANWLIDLPTEVSMPSEAPRASITPPTEEPRFETEQERFLRENAEAIRFNTPASGRADALYGLEDPIFMAALTGAQTVGAAATGLGAKTLYPYARAIGEELSMGLTEAPNLLYQVGKAGLKGAKRAADSGSQAYKDYLSKPYQGFDGNLITRPLTPLGKTDLEAGKQWYRKIGNEKGLRDLIEKGGAQAPKPLKMKSGQSVDVPFFGRGNKPTESYKGLYAVEAKPDAKSIRGWSSDVGGTSNYGSVPYGADNQFLKNVPLEDLNVYRKKFLSNNYRKLDPDNLEEGMKYSGLQRGTEGAFKWGARGAAADYLFNDSEYTDQAIEYVKDKIPTPEYRYGGSLGNYHNGGKIGHTHEDTQYSLPTFSPSVGSETPRASIPSQEDIYEKELFKTIINNKKIAETKDWRGGQAYQPEEVFAEAKEFENDAYTKKLQDKWDQYAATGAFHPSAYPASGTAEYFPLEAMLLPGTPAVKGLGKPANFLLDALNPIGGMGKNPVGGFAKPKIPVGQQIDNMWKGLMPTEFPHSSLSSTHPMSQGYNLGGTGTHPDVYPPVPWSINVPGNQLQLGSTMMGSPLEKQISKEGLINVNNIRSLANKGNTADSDKYIINKVLDEQFPGQKNIDYNDFKDAISKELIPLQRRSTGEMAVHGMKSLGYNPPMPRPHLDKFGRPVESIPEGYPQDILSLESTTFSNKDNFGRGADDHFPGHSDLGHTRSFVSKEEPDVFHVMEAQSDFYQSGGLKHTKEQALKSLDRQKEHLSHMADRKSQARKLPDGSYEFPGNSIPKYMSKEQYENMLVGQTDINKMAAAEIKNWEQKQLLGKTHQERLLQESVDQAVDLGKSKVRYPTAETAIKIEEYTPLSRKALGDNLRDAKEMISHENGITTIRVGRNGDDPNKLGIVIADDTVSPPQYFNRTVRGRQKLSKTEYEKIRESVENKIRKAEADFNSEFPVYSSSDKTILKKYDKAPKMIKKTLGVDAKKVSDSKGNTWYEFDIPQSYKDRTAEIKALGVVGAVGGGAALMNQQNNTQTPQYKMGGTIQGTNKISNFGYGGFIGNINNYQIPMTTQNLYY